MERRGMMSMMVRFSATDCFRDEMGKNEERQKSTQVATAEGRVIAGRGLLLIEPALLFTMTIALFQNEELNC